MFRLSTVLPPLQSADETAHLVRIESLSSGQLLMHTHEGSNSGAWVDSGLAPLFSAFVPLIVSASHAPDAAALEMLEQRHWTHERVFMEGPQSAFYPPVLYLPAALGMATGRLLDLTVMDSVRLARGVGMAATLALWVLAAWVWMPPAGALAVLLLPMNLFQSMAPVPDGLANALTALCLSMFISMYPSGRQTCSVALAVWCAALTALVTTRLHLAPLLLLPAWLALRHRDFRQAAVAGISCALTAAWIGWALASVVDQRRGRSVSALQAALHYLSNPSEAWEVFRHTLGDAEHLAFVYRSFIGMLGWLDTLLPPHAYIWLGCGLVAAMLLDSLRRRMPRAAEQGRPSGSSSGSWLLVALAVLSALLSYGLMLITWTPFPADTIEGVQGRYLIAPALMLAYGLAAPKHDSDPADGVVPMTMARPAHMLAPAPALLNLATAGLLAVFAWVSLSALETALNARYPRPF